MINKFIDNNMRSLPDIVLGHYSILFTPNVASKVGHSISFTPFMTIPNLIYKIGSNLRSL
jgi:hypothetical protein